MPGTVLGNSETTINEMDTAPSITEFISLGITDDQVNQFVFNRISGSDTCYEEKQKKCGIVILYLSRDLNSKRC